MCAGWVCYAEKTHGEWILPYLSTAKSPQAVAGSLIKGGLLCTSSASYSQSAPTNGKTKEGSCCQHSTSDRSAVQGSECKENGHNSRKSHNSRKRLADAMHMSSRSVYHVAIMPCYDKKLEAARSDLTSQQAANGAIHVDGEPVGGDLLPETDCVLTTGELQELLQERGVSLADCQRVPLDDWVEYLSPQDECTAHTERQEAAEAGCKTSGGLAGEGCECKEGGSSMVKGVRGGSGGYSEYTVKHAALALFGQVCNHLDQILLAVYAVPLAISQHFLGRRCSCVIVVLYVGWRWMCAD